MMRYVSITVINDVRDIVKCYLPLKYSDIKLQILSMSLLKCSETRDETLSFLSKIFEANVGNNLSDKMILSSHTTRRYDRVK